MPEVTFAMACSARSRHMRSWSGLAYVAFTCLSILLASPGGGRTARYWRQMHIYPHSWGCVGRLWSHSLHHAGGRIGIGCTNASSSLASEVRPVHLLDATRATQQICFSTRGYTRNNFCRKVVSGRAMVFWFVKLESCHAHSRFAHGSGDTSRAWSPCTHLTLARNSMPGGGCNLGTYEVPSCPPSRAAPEPRNSEYPPSLARIPAP